MFCDSRIFREKFFPRYGVYDTSLNLYIASVNKVVHPDATVLCGEVNSPKLNCIDNPTILVEVTSPTTKDHDYGTKREYYFGLPSLRHYLLVSQTEKLVGHYQRSDNGWTYFDHGPNSMIDLTEVKPPLETIYAGILH